jgi:hypothetical protein
VLGAIDDFWYKWVADVGITGADRGAGGKYLVLPPSYKGDVPADYFVVRPNTYGSWMPFRSFLVDGSPKLCVNSVKKTLKIYQLSDGANPPPMTFADASGIPSNFVFPGDYFFWNLLNEVIQEEPSDGSDPTTLGLFASIGIVKGQPFNPDERMKKILIDAANIGAATARTLAFKIRAKDAYYYPDSQWRLPFFGGYKCESAPGVSNLTARRSITSSPRASRRDSATGPPTTRMAIRSTADDSTNCICRRTVLVRYCLRQSDPLDAPDRSEGTEREQPLPWFQDQTQWLRRRLFRPQGASGNGEELGANDPRQGMVHDPAPVRSARAVVRQNVAAGRDRTAGLEP